VTATVHSRALREHSALALPELVEGPIATITGNSDARVTGVTTPPRGEETRRLGGATVSLTLEAVRAKGRRPFSLSLSVSLLRLRRSLAEPTLSLPPRSSRCRSSSTRTSVVRAIALIPIVRRRDGRRYVCVHSRSSEISRADATLRHPFTNAHCWSILQDRGSLGEERQRNAAHTRNSCRLSSPPPPGQSTLLRSSSNSRTVGVPF